MSHLGVRLLADRFADEDEGVNAITQELAAVLHGGDPLPPDVSIYSDTRDAWVMLGIAPTEDMGVEFPCIRLRTLGVDYTGGVCQLQSTGAVTRSGTLRVVAELLFRAADTEAAAVAGMYLLRSMGSVIARFDDPASESYRTFGGIQLAPSTACTQGTPDAKAGDDLVCPGALLITYPFTETVSLPLSLG